MATVLCLRHAVVSVRVGQSVLCPPSVVAVVDALDDTAVDALDAAAVDALDTPAVDALDATAVDALDAIAVDAFDAPTVDGTVDSPAAS